MPKTIFTEAMLKRLMREGKPSKKNQPVSVGSGLYMRVEGVGEGTWQCRLKIGKSRSPKNIVPYAEAPTLVEGRFRYHEYKRAHAAGKNPAAERRAKKAAGPEITTVMALVEDEYIAHKAPTWKPHTLRNRTGLFKNHVFPLIGRLHPSDVTVRHVEKVLERIYPRPQWEVLQQQMECAFNRAMVLGLMQENPARYKGCLDTRFRKGVHNKKRQPAIPVPQVPDYCRLLLSQNSAVADSCLLLVFTGTRLSEARDCVWSEINFDTREWSIPAQRRKGRKGKEEPLTVPLSQAMLEIIERQPRRSEFVFTKADGRPIDRDSINELMDRLHAEKLAKDGVGWVDIDGRKAVPHGFRSTQSKWALIENVVPECIIDSALSHSGGDKKSLEYFRPDEIICLHRKLREAYSAYLTGETVNEKPELAEVEA